MVAEELFYYTYPFIFPDFLQQKLAKHEFEVVFKAVQVLTSENLEKVFFIEEYFKNYPSILSNSEKTKIKDFQTILKKRFNIEKRNSFSIELQEKFEKSSQELDSLKKFIEEKQICFYKKRKKELEDEIQELRKIKQ